MNTQTQAEAASLARELDLLVGLQDARYPNFGIIVAEAAAELRRLHAENEGLRAERATRMEQNDRMAARIAELEAQAQPAREPTTEKHLMELADSLGYEPLNPARVDFMYGYRKAEAACGITKEKP